MPTRLQSSVVTRSASIGSRSKSRVTLLLAAAAALASAPATAQLDPGFEASADEAPGWELRDRSGLAERDATVARSGRRSLRLSADRSEGRIGFSQSLDPRELDGDRIRVRAFIRYDREAAAEPTLRVRVDGDRGLLYISRASRIAAPDAQGWRAIDIDAPLAAGATRLDIGGELNGPGTVWFDDFEVAALSTDSLPPASPRAARYVDDALEVIDAHAIERGRLDWPRYRAAVIAQNRGAITEADAHLAVQFALAELGDGHSYFMTPRQMDALDDRPLGNARTARAPRAPEARELDGRIAYLRLPGIAGGAHGDRVEFAEAVQALLAEHDLAAGCGWILDLRDNQGGNLWPMLAGIGPLLGSGEIGASLGPGDERRSIWYVDGKAGLGDFVQLRVRGTPPALRHAGAPVAVLLNDDTASAAEIVAAAFAGRPLTRSFGAATGGATSATRTFPMSDGAALMLAVAKLTDRSGRPLPAHIEPDQWVADAPRGEPLSVQAPVAAASRWLGERCAAPDA
jgi:carboxyl-terminal processing protease